MGNLWAQLLLQFYTKLFFKFAGVFVMGYPPIIYYHFFPFFFFFFFFFFGVFQSPISIRIDTLWVQLILQFSTHSFFIPTHTCSTWSEDMRVVLG